MHLPARAARRILIPLRSLRNLYELFLYRPSSFCGSETNEFLRLIWVENVQGLSHDSEIIDTGELQTDCYCCSENSKWLTRNFSVNGLCTENRLQSQQTPTPYQIKVNNCKLIDLVKRIELTRPILMPRFSNILRNSSINFRMFLYFETCFLRVTVSLPCRLQAVSKIHAPIYPYLIGEGRRNCSTFWPA